MVDLKGVKRRFRSLRRHLDERTRRLFAAAESEAIGRGGISAVSAAIGMSRRVVREGKRDLRARVTPPTGRLRQPGGGRKKMVVEDPSLLVDLERLVEPLSRGDPESPLRWTCKSVRKLAAELQARGHRVRRQLVLELLHALDSRLQGNRKTLDGSDQPDRDDQFTHIDAQVQAQLAAGEPAISV